GQLTIMCGGNEDHLEVAKPVMDFYGKQVTLMGECGAGQLTKMVNQICIAGLIQSLSEGVQFATKAGLNVEQVFDVIGKGAAQSWQMDNRHKTMIEDRFDHGFAVDWMRKDLAICLEEARRNESSLPVAALVDQFYSEVQRMGGGRWDTSSLLKRLLLR
ncbi:MAG: NAD(P)-dependent oxidoreductase, partial [Ketobacter sp.]